MIKNILTIAGSDSGGGAGIQADLKTVGALGGYGLSVVTAVTAQNTQGVRDVHVVPVENIRAQLTAVFEDIRIDAVKIGMVGSAGIAAVIVDVLREYQPHYIVLDPVMVATSGDVLASKDTIAAIRDQLTPLASVITPNIPEAEILSGRECDDMLACAQGLLTLGSAGVLLKGGHGTGPQSVDVFADADGAIDLSAPRIPTDNTHGTGCTLSSALACFLAQGLSFIDAAKAAKVYVSAAIRAANDLDVGNGAGPLNHFFKTE